MPDERKRQQRLAKKRARRQEKRVTKRVAYHRRTLPASPPADLAPDWAKVLAGGLPKMSDNILAFAKPLVDELIDEDSGPLEVRAVLLLAAMVWNVTVETDTPSDGLRNEVVGKLSLALARPRAACMAFLSMLQERKRQLFADDPRIVLDVQTYWDGTEIRIIASSRLWPGRGGMLGRRRARRDARSGVLSAAARGRPVAASRSGSVATVIGVGERAAAKAPYGAAMALPTSVPQA